ncbi:hypothetical protein M422DRAFT_171119, partial [Sphaerobolus stellatus SS14]
FTTNNGYYHELTSHWISPYFLRDKMNILTTPEAALSIPNSYSSDLAFWTYVPYNIPMCITNAVICRWLQASDDLLEGMKLPTGRSGRNWLTWPFKVIDLKEIKTLKEERQMDMTL